MAYNPETYISGGKRTPFEKEVDYVEEARLYLQGYTLQQIADRINEIRGLDLSYQAIQYDMKVIRKRWKERYIQDFEEAKSQELAKIDQLEMAYWEAWEQSKKPKETTEAVQTDDNWQGKRGGSPGYKRQKVTRKKETRDPSAVYLQGIERCIDKRIKILGLGAPKTVNVNWRKEAEEAGIDPDKAYNDLVNQFLDAARQPRDEEESREHGDGGVD